MKWLHVHGSGGDPIDQHFTALEFRDGVSGGRTGLREGPDVWEVVSVARDYDGDLNALAAHFGGLIPVDALAQALEYAERFPDEVESRIEQNRQTEQVLRSDGRG